MSKLVRFDDTTTAVSTELQNARAQAGSFARSSRAKNTKRNYTSDMKTFDLWCGERGCRSLPANPLDVAAYLAARAASGIKTRTVFRNAAGIGQAHVLTSRENPCDTPEVRETLAGIARELGGPPDRKLPFTAEMVRRYLVESPAEHLADVRDRAIVAFGFAVAQRSANLAKFKASDLTEDSRGLRVLISRSKTDQKGVGLEVGVPKSSAAYAVIKAWLEAGAIEASDPLFFRLDKAAGDKRKPLSEKTVCRVVKQAAELLGEDAKLYGSHSLRAGFVTSATLNGADLSAIMAQTGHKSVPVVMGYIRRASIFDKNALEGLL